MTMMGSAYQHISISAYQHGGYFLTVEKQEAELRVMLPLS